VVALIKNAEATLKYIEQTAEQMLLLPANAHMTALSYCPEQVAIQGVSVGQMRSYRAH
jgi:repressor LexA